MKRIHRCNSNSWWVMQSKVIIFVCVLIFNFHHIFTEFNSTLTFANLAVNEPSLIHTTQCDCHFRPLFESGIMANTLCCLCCFLILGYFKYLPYTCGNLRPSDPLQRPLLTTSIVTTNTQQQIKYTTIIHHGHISQRECPRPRPPRSDEVEPYRRSRHD